MAANTITTTAPSTIKAITPRERITGIELDKQRLTLFDKLNIEDKKALQWLQRVIRQRMQSEVQENTAMLRDIHRQIERINKDRDTLLTLRVHQWIEADTYARKECDYAAL